MTKESSKDGKKAHSALEGIARGAGTYKLEADDVLIIGLDTDDGVEHILMDPERINEGWTQPQIDSVIKYGVLKPILVRKNGKRKDGSPILEVVDGRQRTKWVREANRQLTAAGKTDRIILPALFKDDEDDRMQGMVDAANVHIVSSPLAKARRARHRIDQGVSEHTVAVDNGVTLTTMRGWLSMLTLAKPLIKAIEDGRLGATVAQKIASGEYSHEEQVAKLEEMIANGTATVETAMREARQKSGKIKTPAAEDAQYPVASKSVVKKLWKVISAKVEANKPIDLTEETIALIGWLNEEKSPRTITGLAPLLTEIKKAKERAIERKKERLAKKAKEEKAAAKAEAKSRAPDAAAG